jgi:hypothetical protein
MSLDGSDANADYGDCGSCDLELAAAFFVSRQVEAAELRSILVTAVPVSQKRVGSRASG